MFVSSVVAVVVTVGMPYVHASVQNGKSVPQSETNVVRIFDATDMTSLKTANIKWIT